jgi:hypothetical protein
MPPDDEVERLTPARQKRGDQRAIVGVDQVCCGRRVRWRVSPRHPGILRWHPAQYDS